MKLTHLSAAIAGVVLASQSAYAESAPLKATIPFDFHVKDKAMPAGRFEVLRGRHPALTLLQRDAGSPAAFVLASPVETRGAGTGSARLVFHRYGGSYFLHQIWSANGVGQELSKSRREAELSRNSSPVEVALTVD